MRYKRLIEVYMCNWKFASATPALRHVRQFLAFQPRLATATLVKLPWQKALEVLQVPINKHCWKSVWMNLDDLFHVFIDVFMYYVQHACAARWTFSWSCFMVSLHQGMRQLQMRINEFHCNAVLKASPWHQQGALLMRMANVQLKQDGWTVVWWQGFFSKKWCKWQSGSCDVNF